MLTSLVPLAQQVNPTKLMIFKKSADGALCVCRCYMSTSSTKFSN